MLRGMFRFCMPLIATVTTNRVPTVDKIRSYFTADLALIAILKKNLEDIFHHVESLLYCAKITRKEGGNCANMDSFYGTRGTHADAMTLQRIYNLEERVLSFRI